MLILASLLFLSLACQNAADEQEELQALIKDVKSKLNKENEGTGAVKSSLDNLLVSFKEGKVDFTVYSGVLNTLVKSVEKIQSDDPPTVIIGFLNIMSSVSGVIPGLQAYSTLFAALSSIFGLFESAKAQKSVGDIIKEALTAQQAEELKREAYGTKKVYDMSKAFLDGVRQGEASLKGWEVSALSANFPIYSGAKFLAILWKYIEETTPSNKKECLRVIKLLDSYCKLWGLRKMLLYDLYSTISSAGNSPNIAKGTKRVYDMSDFEFKEPLTYLLKGDNKDKFALLMTLYPKEQNPAIFAFLNASKIPDPKGYQDDYSGKYYITNFKWPDYHLAMYVRTTSRSGGEKVIGGTTQKISVELSRLEDGYYTLGLSDEYIAKWGNLGMTRSDKNNVSDKNKFHLLPFQDDEKSFYLLKFKCQTDCLSNKYLYMKSNTDGSIREDTYEDMGNQGKWNLKLVGKKSILRKKKDVGSSSHRQT